LTTGTPSVPFDVVGEISFLYSSRNGILPDSAAALIRQYREQMRPGGGPSLARADPGSFTLVFTEASQTFEQVFLLTSQELRRRAAALGADAVVGMRHDVDLAASDRECVYVDVAGTAVRFRGPRRAAP
jgi:hypothetical protein